jgi:hypothetical protein
MRGEFWETKTMQVRYTTTNFNPFPLRLAVLRWITAGGYELQRVWSSVKLTAVFLLAIVGVGCAGHKAPLSQVIIKPTCDRLITANVVALDQVYYYNRFGAFNPAGIMYALRRDVVKTGDGKDEGPEILNEDLDGDSDEVGEPIPLEPTPGVAGE